MKSIAVFLFLLFFPLLVSVNAQPSNWSFGEYQKFSGQSEVLKGKVWTISETAIWGNQSFGGNLRIFDTDGKLTDFIVYVNQLTKDRSEINFQQIRKTTFTYDKTGRLSKSIHCFSDREIADINISDKKYCFSKAYAFDEKNRLIKETELDAKGSVMSTATYVYNSKNDLTEITCYFLNRKMSKPVKACQAIYDAQNNLIESALLSKDLQRREINKYDTERHLIESSSDFQLHRDSPMKLDYKMNSKLMFFYKYDSHGNWIEQHASPDGALKDDTSKSGKVVGYRTITYYPDDARSGWR